MRRFRAWLAGWLYEAAQRVGPVAADAKGPRCPDCQIGPDVGDDCPVCRDSWERQKTDEAIYGAGYEDARREAEMEADHR